MWVNVIPDCSEATGSKPFLEETWLMWCCNNSYIFSLVTDQLKREIPYVIVCQELQYSDGKGKAFSVLRELIARTC